MPKKDQPSHIKSHDYRAWDKYNAEEEAGKVDTESKGRAKASTKTRVSAQLSDKGDILFNSLFLPSHFFMSDFPELSMSSANKEKLSVNEKEKGNEVCGHTYYIM